MARALLVLAVLSACGPESPDGAEAGMGSGDAATVTPTTTGEATTGVVTTGGVTTGDASSTGPAPVCAWEEPGNKSYCPLLAAANIDIVGDTPMGPVAFKYAYFGLNKCDWCFDPSFPAIGLFAEEQSPGLDPFVGDHLLIEGVWQFPPWSVPRGMIGGESFEIVAPTEVDVSERMVATREQTTPPFDAPPTMSGELSITGGGWMLAGEYTASLCTALNWTPICD